MIGFDATETRRTYGDVGDDARYDIRYPLIEWGWTRERCEREIAQVGLPVPVKSACYCCPAAKTWEIKYLREHVPEQYAICEEMERKYRQGKHYRGHGSVQGLGVSKAWTIRDTTQMTLFDT
jgi:hypothetical protein